MSSRYKPATDKSRIITIDLAKRNSDKTVKRKCHCVTIEGQDYQECKNATFWSSSKSSDNYDEKTPFPDGTGDVKVATGLFGETATAILFDLEVDLGYREKGDDCDFLVDDEKWDVKTAMKKGIRPNIMAKRSPIAKYVPMKDRYIVGFIQNHDLVGQTVEVVMVGYFNREDVEFEELFSSKKYPKISNYDVYFSESKPLVK